MIIFFTFLVSTFTEQDHPLSFEANDGQVDDQAKFFSRGQGYNLFLTPTESVLVLTKASKAKDFVQTNPGSIANYPESQEMESAVVRMRLEGANLTPEMSGINMTSSKSNYLIGDDKSKWRTNVSQYSKVKYQEVYEGIDLVYYGNQRKLEYDFIVQPGADYKQIQMNFSGADKLSLDNKGNLVMATPTGNVIQYAPIIYQVIDGERKPVEGNYVLQDEARVSFQVAQYDAEKELVIDPILVYSTYLGGENFDSGYGMDVDEFGNVYVTGKVQSIDFPEVNSAQGFQGGEDAFVAKLDSTGALVYSTYIGGSSDDVAYGIAVDGSGNIHITGTTISNDFPTDNAIQGDQLSWDAFVVKLDTSGDLVYSTYLGGNSYDFGNKIAVDKLGNAYVAGSTESTDFPTENAGQYDQPRKDAFVTKLDSSGSLVYSTYLGGSDTDNASGIAVDDQGSAYITGRTWSTDFPTVSAFQDDQPDSDVFIAKLNPAGGLAYSTYLGGSGTDWGYGITVGNLGSVYVTGWTDSSDFPLVNASYSTYEGRMAFVTKFNPLGDLVYSTYLELLDRAFSEGHSIATDASGNAYITGETTN